MYSGFFDITVTNKRLGPTGVKTPSATGTVERNQSLQPLDESAVGGSGSENQLQDTINVEMGHGDEFEMSKYSCHELEQKLNFN